MKPTITKLLALILATFALPGWLNAGPPPADVSEGESFGRPALYMGAATGDISLANECGPMPAPVPPNTANNNQCFALNAAPASTTFNAVDVCRIKLPKKATRSIIYPALNFFVGYELKNNTGSFQDHGRFRFLAVVSVESDTLLDPTIIDPRTGEPANGKIDGLFIYSYEEDRSMQPEDRQRQRLMLSRVGNAGISKASLVGLGFPQSVVDNLFNSAMTVRISVTGTVQLLNDQAAPSAVNPATITANMRLFGD